MRQAEGLEVGQHGQRPKHRAGQSVRERAIEEHLAKAQLDEPDEADEVRAPAGLSWGRAARHTASCSSCIWQCARSLRPCLPGLRPELDQ